MGIIFYYKFLSVCVAIFFEFHFSPAEKGNVINKMQKIKHVFGFEEERCRKEIL